MSDFNPLPIINALQAQGYAVIDNALSAECIQQSRDLFKARPGTDFKPAGVGPGQAQRLADIRRDKIYWLLPEQTPELIYWQAMESLRIAANQAFYLGLFDFECHFAQYNSGDFYQKHWDAFRGKSNRKLSTVFYLTEHWSAADGGELVIYREDDPSLEAVRVEPLPGRLVVFLSENFAHEVLPAKKTRLSITGWFRVRAR